MKPVLQFLVEQLMLFSLRRTFTCVEWVTPPPALPRDRPVVLYANHHTFYDGYLLWLIAAHWQQRTPLIWMAEWDRMPIFTMVGAQPFPLDDAQRRAATLRRTIRTFRDDPQAALGYFPEGRLHPAEEGIDAFDPAFMQTLDRLFPDKLWWPIGIHLTWRTEAHPVAQVGGGPLHATADGTEVERLRQAWMRVHSADPVSPIRLVDGVRGANERWNFAALRSVFARYL